MKKTFLFAASLFWTYISKAFAFEGLKGEQHLSFCANVFGNTVLPPAYKAYLHQEMECQESRLLLPCPDLSLILFFFFVGFVSPLNL